MVHRNSRGGLTAVKPPPTHNFEYLDEDDCDGNESWRGTRSVLKKYSDVKLTTYDESEHEIHTPQINFCCVKNTCFFGK